MKNRYKMALLRGGMVLAMLTTLVMGCIKNDVPYEIILGEITQMEIRGSESLTINNEGLVIDLVLADTVDLRRVFMKDFNITSDAIVKDDITGELMDTLDSYYLDLTQGGGAEHYFIAGPESKSTLEEKPPYTFTVMTYQDYVWTLNAKQNVKREFTLTENQIGESMFSVTENSVRAHVPKGLPLTDIKIADLKLGPSNATMAWIDPSGKEVPNVDYKAITFDFAGKDQYFIVRFLDIEQRWTVSVEESDENFTDFLVDSWAKYANLSSQGLVSAGAPGFEIRKAGDGDDKWVAVTGVKVEGGTFTATAPDLTPETDYQARALIDKGQGDVDYSDILDFKSEAMVGLPNLDFDDGYFTNVGSIKYVYYPNAEGASFWTTGNEGGKYMAGLGLNENVTVPVEGADTRTGTGKALQMTTYYVDAFMGVKSLATGTVFSGKFGPMVGTPMNPDAQRKFVHYGQPYIGRPKALKGWYKYMPKDIDIAITDDGQGIHNLKYASLMGTVDNCKIYISLEAWGDEIVRPLSPVVVGYGEWKSGATAGTSNNGYVEFGFDIDYTSATKPTHIVMCATSSALSDDFCGGAGSQLYIDDFELVWE